MSDKFQSKLENAHFCLTLIKGRYGWKALINNIRDITFYRLTRKLHGLTRKLYGLTRKLYRLTRKLYKLTRTMDLQKSFTYQLQRIKKQLKAYRRIGSYFFSEVKNKVKLWSINCFALLVCS